VTAAAAIAMFLGPARADASDHDDRHSGTLLEGWANRDLDIGAFSSAASAAGQPSWPVQILPYIEQPD
jgi:hypothetical protein